MGAEVGDVTGACAGGGVTGAWVELLSSDIEAPGTTATMKYHSGRTLL